MLSAMAIEPCTGRVATTPPRPLFLACATMLALCVPSPHAALRTGHATVSLEASVASIAPGDSFHAALRILPDSGWHVYWSNPGDAGLPPELSWALPEGWSAGALQYPYPEFISTPPFASHGYHEEAWYLSPLKAAPDASGRAVLRARAAWLVCREECLPESVNLELRVPVGKTRPATHANAWKQAFARLPVPAPPDWNWSATYHGDSLELSFETPADWDPSGSLRFFPLEAGVLDHAAPQRIHGDHGRVVLTLARDPVLKETPRRIRGVLVSGTGWPVDTNGTRRAALLVDVDSRPAPEPARTGILILAGGLALLVLVAVSALSRRKPNHRSSP